MRRLPWTITLLWALLAMPHAVWATPDAMREDVRQLTAHPHRLSGSTAAQEAAAYIESRLRAMGIEEVFPLDMPVWQTTSANVTLQVGSSSIALLPMRPNVTVTPTTPPQGLTGPLYYLGRGRSSDYGTRDVSGAIVVLEYDSGTNWQRAFAQGATAVIFLGSGDERDPSPRHAGVPANLPRFYAPADVQQALDLRRDHESGTLNAQAPWTYALGRNIIARIPGTDPTFASVSGETEVLVLAAHYDTFGIVPLQSPGARGAANVAALLQAAETFAQQPSRRDVLILFLDNRARYHQGARQTYHALLAEAVQVDNITNQQRQALSWIRLQRQLFEAHGFHFQRADRALQDENGQPLTTDHLSNLNGLLRSQADFARADIAITEQTLRIELYALGSEDAARKASLEQQLDDWRQQRDQWDGVRRALHQRRLAEFLDERATDAEDAALRQVLDALRAQVSDRLQQRERELQIDLAISEQMQLLRSAVWVDQKAPGIVLHVNFDLSDASRHWGLVVGDWTAQLIGVRWANPQADRPGYYGGVLSAFRSAMEQRPALDGLDAETLRNPLGGLYFAASPFVSSGYVAGGYGVYNLSLMTAYDGRIRDGQPSDTLAHLDLDTFSAQASEAIQLLAAVVDEPTLSPRQALQRQIASNRATWTAGRPDGPSAMMMVSGDLSENRPASNAMMAMIPSSMALLNNPWQALADNDQITDFETISLMRVNADGRFDLIGLRGLDLDAEPMLLGTITNERGQVQAITTQESLLHRIGASIRVDLFKGDGYIAQAWAGQPLNPSTLRILRAANDAPFRLNRTLYGQSAGATAGVTFFYISDQVVNRDVKLFQSLGPVALNIHPQAPLGEGYPVELFENPPNLAPITARDLWRLNEERLASLRVRGVTSGDLEVLHAGSRRYREAAQETPQTALREAMWLRAGALAHRVHGPVRQTMNDLVYSVVMLLLLAIPFAFMLERLVICSTSVYSRIGWFSLIFLATFGLLYLMHPGFTIATTPIIIFLAFAIILLSAMVIHIIVRKFQTELKAIQGQGNAAHDIEVSQTATTLAAIGMGMSTMRRRPMRTALTAITVVMLTFTILCFASFSRVIGVRASYVGPLSEQVSAGLLLRNLDFSPLDRGLLDLLQGAAGEQGQISGQWWLTQHGQGDTPVPFAVANPRTGQSVQMSAIMGLDPQEVVHWPQLAAALAGESSLDAAGIADALEEQGVFLPLMAQEQLELKIGDLVLVNGRPMRFAGVFGSSSMQRLRQLDGQSILPVQFEQIVDPTMQQQGEQPDDGLLLVDDIERNFVPLSASRVAIVSDRVIQENRGSLHIVNLYPDESLDATQTARQLAEILVMPIWVAGFDGVERMLLAVLTEVSGGLALAVPLILGGLIIFGTLLGSISDREKEIYTFSALGLSPQHVGVLFFAEAAVYAVIGGMGGQLLAQLVGVAASALASAGYIQPIMINHSSTNAIFAIAVVMLTVLGSAIYPALRASRSANPGLARAWRMPAAEGDTLNIVFPFTVSAYDITGVVSYLGEHFRRHVDAGLGRFAASNVTIYRDADDNLVLACDLALSPFDLGVTQHMALSAVPSKIPGVDEVALCIQRRSGAAGDWYRANKVFLRDLRRQFLLWRTLNAEMIEKYRRETLQTLGEAGPSPDAMAGANPQGA